MTEDYPSGSGEFAVGAQIAGYRLEEQIGRGGMAVVYRALDIRLDRHVALKILAPGLALDEAFRQRFIRESRAAAAVDHPHIIPVFDAGEANGVLFIAMRYVHGGDVRTLLDTDGQLAAVRAADIITQVASALDAAHSHGLVHRDVKPGNMLLDSTSGSGRQDHVYLSDFGLSKQSLSVTGLTSTGQFLGTLDYVAPEQIEGRQVDGRADLYALACASFEMLCGAPPFRRDQGLAVVWAQLSEPPPSLRARRADLPEAVDAVLAKAMAKAPADRYPTCLAFAAALREALGLLVPGFEAPGSPEGGPPAGGLPTGGPPAAGPAAAAAAGSWPEPRAHPPTEISTPGQAAAAGAGETAAAAGAMGAVAGGPPAGSGPGTGPGNGVGREVRCQVGRGASCRAADRGIPHLQADHARSDRAGQLLVGAGQLPQGRPGRLPTVSGLQRSPAGRAGRLPAAAPSMVAVAGRGHHRVRGRPRRSGRGLRGAAWRWRRWRRHGRGQHDDRGRAAGLRHRGGNRSGAVQGPHRKGVRRR